MINGYLPNDKYKPLVPKPSLQQYDNYQIHDLYCTDIIYSGIVVDGEKVKPPSPTLRRNFLAVEKVSPYGTIKCNFEAIAIAYQ